jgi:hypothetical protein
VLLFIGRVDDQKVRQWEKELVDGFTAGSNGDASVLETLNAGENS